MRAVSKKVMKGLMAVTHIEKANKAYEMLMANTPKMIDIVWKINKRFPGLLSTPSASTERYSAYISKYNLESFKCEELTEILEFLLSLNPTETDTSQYASSYNTDYRFDFDCIRITVFAYVKHDSPNCRRVVVGEETVTQYKYEMVCDGDMPATEASDDGSDELI
jgi:hypothetical protein